MSPTNRLPIYSKLNLSRMKARPLYLSDGRIFYLWQDEEARELFDTLGFKVCDFLNPDPRSLPAQLNFSEKRSRANLTGEPWPLVCLDELCFG